MNENLKFDESTYETVVTILQNLKQDIDGVDEHNNSVLSAFQENGMSAYLAEAYGSELDNLDSIAQEIYEKLELLFTGELSLEAGREAYLQTQQELIGSSDITGPGGGGESTPGGQASVASQAGQVNQISQASQEDENRMVDPVVPQASLLSQAGQATVVNQAGQQVLYGPGPVNQVNQTPQVSIVTQASQANQASQITQASVVTQATQASHVSQATQASIVSQLSQATQASIVSQLSQATQASHASVVSQLSQASQASHASVVSQLSQASQVTQASQVSHVTQASVVNQATQASQASHVTQATQASMVTQASHAGQASYGGQASQASRGSSIGTGTSKGKSTSGKGKNAASSLKGAAGKKASNIIDAIEKGAARLAKGISPRFSGEDGSGMSAAAIAGAGLAGAGVALGTGILVGKRFQTYTFTPEDWENVDEPTKDAILKDMNKAEFSESEIETFKNSTFKIRASELNEHTKKITKANEIDETLEEQLKAVYNYSLFDDENNIVRYFTFITMILDGKKATDDFNMYNILNPILGEEDEADFIYTGISMEEYIVDEDDSEEIEVEEAEQESEEIQEGRSVDAVDKEWLTGIGLDNN